MQYVQAKLTKRAGLGGLPEILSVWTDAPASVESVLNKPAIADALAAHAQYVRSIHISDRIGSATVP